MTTREVALDETGSTRRWLTAGVLVAATAALVFQQSPGNETVRANGAFRVLRETDDEIAAAAMVFAITMVIEGVTSLLIAAGFSLPGRSLETRLQRFRSKVMPTSTDGAEDPSESWPARLMDTGITLSLGPGLVVVRRHFQEPARTLRADVRTLFGYCIVGSLVSGLIGYLVVGGTKHAEKVGLGTPAEHFVDWAADWKFWTALLGTGYSINWIVKKLRGRRTPAAAGVA